MGALFAAFKLGEGNEVGSAVQQRQLSKARVIWHSNDKFEKTSITLETQNNVW